MHSYVHTVAFRMESLCRFRSSKRRGGMPRIPGVDAMLDVIFVTLMVALFTLMAAYAYACDKL
jgi:hypothetical protein